jgi:Fic family protein
MNTLAALEACASAKIDRFTTTIDQFFQHAGDDGEPTDPGTRAAFRYRTALQRGVDSLKERPLSTATAVGVCREICSVELGIRTQPAAAFTNQVGVTLYTPPCGEALVRELLANWERYLHDASIDPLIRMAVGHYQFEAIHPFSDGNGATGRILSQLYLVEQELLELPILHLSRATIWNQADCYRQLNNVTRSGAWEPWILSLVNAVNETARWTTAKILAMRSLLLETTRHIQRQALSLYSRELVELVFAHPYCRIANLVQAGLAKRQTASVYLKELSDIGILDDVKVGRDKLFIHLKLVALLKSEQHAFPQYDS